MGTSNAVGKRDTPAQCPTSSGDTSHTQGKEIQPPPARISTLSAHLRPRISARFSPVLHKPLHPFLPEAHKTPAVWRPVSLRQERTRRSAGKPPLPRDALIEFERRHRLRKRVGAARLRRLPQWRPARQRQYGCCGQLAQVRQNHLHLGRVVDAGDDLCSTAFCNSASSR